MNTILITGCSSGFGLATARHFLDQGWRVVAAMRTPTDGLLPPSDRLTVTPLDVRDPGSIARAVAEAGPIDVLVNNAGIGWMNPLESTPLEMVRDLFETNTFGTIAMTRAVLPQFRARRAGVVINVTSSVTLKPLHFLSVYTASKAAVNALTDCLALELVPLGLRVHAVLPGRAPSTQFGASARSRSHQAGALPDAYDAQMLAVRAAFAQAPQDQITHEKDVAAAIWRAATDPDSPLYLPAGADAAALFAR
jgi:NAD(P)-dependent dehydrogenase (short-subunit alcohol dehydrogenase family)